MVLTSASLLISIGWILWAWAYASHSRAVPAAWTRVTLLSTVAVFAVVACICFGIGALVAALVSPEGPLHGQTATTLAVTVIAPVLAFLIAPRLRRALGGPVEA